MTTHPLALPYQWSRWSDILCIVEGVEQIAVERMNVDEAREALDRGLEALGESLCCVFDLAGIEGADTADLEASANLRGKTSLAAEKLAPPQWCIEGVRKRTFGREQYPGTPDSWEPRECLSTASSW
jgi:hypothetical protein